MNFKNTFLIIISITLSYSTQQISEKIILDQDTLKFAQAPLQTAKLYEGKLNNLIPGSSALWRGYIGTWEIKNDSLFIIDFIGYADNDTLDYFTFFETRESEIFADWYSGSLEVFKEECEGVQIYFNGLFKKKIVIENGIVSPFESLPIRKIGQPTFDVVFCDNFEDLPDTLSACGKVTAVSPLLIQCGVLCGSGTVKIELELVPNNYPFDKLYLVIPCGPLSESEYLNNSYQVEATKLISDDQKSNCYLSGISNSIDSSGIPFYWLDKGDILEIQEPNSCQ